MRLPCAVAILLAVFAAASVLIPVSAAAFDESWARVPYVFLGDFSQAAILFQYYSEKPSRFSIAAAYSDGAGGLFFALDPAPRKLYHWSPGEAAAALVAIDDGFGTAPSAALNAMTLGSGFLNNAYAGGRTLFLQSGRLFMQDGKETRALPTPAFPALDAYFFIADDLVAVVCGAFGISILNTGLDPEQPLVVDRYRLENIGYDFRAFRLANPDIQLIPSAVDDDDSREDQLKAFSDQYFLQQYPGAFDIHLFSTARAESLCRLGLLHDISGEQQLREVIDRYYPPIRAALSWGPRLMGIPDGLEFHGWWLDRELWDALGLGKEPETLDELIAALDYSIHMVVKGRFGIIPIWSEAGFYSDILTGAMRTQYILEYGDASRPLTFDTPAFRKLLEQSWRQSKAERYVWENLRSDASDENLILGSDEWALVALKPYIEFNENVFLPPVFEAGQSPKVEAAMLIWAIPAQAKNKRQAYRFLLFMDRNRTHYERRLYEPVAQRAITDPRVEEKITAQTLQKAQLMAAEGSIDPAIAAEAMRKYDLEIADLEKKRIRRTDRAVEIYEKTIAPALCFPADWGDFSGSASPVKNDIDVLLVEFFRGEIDIDQTIRKLDDLAIDFWLRRNDAQ